MLEGSELLWRRLELLARLDLLDKVAHVLFFAREIALFFTPAGAGKKIGESEGRLIFSAVHVRQQRTQKRRVPGALAADRGVLLKPKIELARGNA